MKRLLTIVFFTLLSMSALAGQHWRLVDIRGPWTGFVDYNVISGKCEIVLYQNPEGWYGVIYQARVGWVVSGWIVEDGIYDPESPDWEEIVSTYTRGASGALMIFVDEEKFEFPPDQVINLYFELRSNKGRLVDTLISEDYYCDSP